MGFCMSSSSGALGGLDSGAMVWFLSLRLTGLHFKRDLWARRLDEELLKPESP